MSTCQCDDGVLAAPHRELQLGPAPKPSSGLLVITSIDLHPLEVTYFAPVELSPPGICLSGQCPKEGPVRFELVGPGGQITRRHGTWDCRSGDERARCQGPVETWRGSSRSDAWLDIAPDHEALRVFVGEQLVYSTKRSKLPMSARVVLLTEPEYALALSFGDGEPEGSFVAVNLDAPMVNFHGTSLKVRRRPQGCWSLIELGDRPFVDPLWVRLSDGFRTEIHELPLQDGVPPAPRPRASSRSSQGVRSTRAPRLARAHLARRTFTYEETLTAADFSFSDLRKAYFRGVGATDARLRRAKLQQAYVRHGNFSGADFSEADLSGAYLIGVELREADFRGANLARTRLDRCDLRGAELERARNLTQAQLDVACGDPQTKLPPGLRIKTCWQPEASWQAAARVDGAGPPPSAELLVATPSGPCTTEPCRGPCCNSCGRVQWKLASDSNVEVVPQGIALPDLVANACGLHYDLRAQAQRSGDRLLVRSVQPVPSEHGRLPGTPGRLELQAKLGACTVMGCSPENPCCNHCSFEGWRPKPTLDLIEWSGEALPAAEGGACDQGFDLAVTGTWLGPSAFEVKTVRKLRW